MCDKNGLQFPSFKRQMSTMQNPSLQGFKPVRTGMNLFWALLLFFSSCAPPQKACKDDSICSKYEICVDQKCVPGCRNDAQCPEKQYCIDLKCTDKICKAGTKESCYSGPPKTLGVGLCRSGERWCAKDGKSWSPCYGEIKPQKEICDLEDNNCNGQTDEDEQKKPLDCKCDPGQKRQCYTGSLETNDKGTCKMGVQHCTEVGRWGTCRGQKHPTREVCDQADNDCNGKVDDGIACDCAQEGQKRKCYTGPPQALDKGPCVIGEQICTKQDGALTWSKCNGEKLPTLEEDKPCNNIDDDCDGKVDNKTGQNNPLEKKCYSGPKDTADKGICKSGRQFCVEGSWQACQEQIQPGFETCNGKDDDCNGKVDDQLEERPCYTKGKGCKKNPEDRFYTCSGLCQPGTSACKDGKWGACQGDKGPANQEDCTNGEDDDCDGKVDNGAACNCTPSGAKRKCYTGPKGTQGKGTCKDGTQTCEGNRWGSCEGQVQPTQEICDGKDNDCDGTPDNLNGSCTIQGQKGRCQIGKWLCLNNKPFCQKQHNPETERCDGKDNDCDGIPDNINKSKPDCTNNNLHGPCKKGKWACVNQKATCESTVKPQKEDCNGKDDDCDGFVDNMLRGNKSQLTQACFTQGSGCQKQSNGSYKCNLPCQTGRRTCQNGTWTTCQGESKPQTESCNGKDDDCDGIIDNKPGSKDPLGQPCYPSGTFPGKGECKRGIFACENGKWSSVCSNAIVPTKEVCDGKDNDCNGQVDDNLTSQGKPCTDNTKSPPCNIGITACVQGKNICKGNPQKEICDNKDNDCDGKIDNANAAGAPLQQSCFPTNQQGCTGKPGSVLQCQGGCKAGTQQCFVGKWGPCNNAVLGTAEVCDNQDNDCDGQVDEAQDLQTQLIPCLDPKQKGACRLGKKACEKGVLVCKPGTSSAEVCDGLDNNCNGDIDEGLKSLCIRNLKGNISSGGSMQIFVHNSAPHLAFVDGDLLRVVNLNDQTYLLSTLKIKRQTIQSLFDFETEKLAVRIHKNNKDLVLFSQSKAIHATMGTNGPATKGTFLPGDYGIKADPGKTVGFLDMQFDTTTTPKKVYLTFRTLEPTNNATTFKVLKTVQDFTKSWKSTTDTTLTMNAISQLFVQENSSSTNPARVGLWKRGSSKDFVLFDPKQKSFKKETSAVQTTPFDNKILIAGGVSYIPVISYGKTVAGNKHQVEVYLYDITKGTFQKKWTSTYPQSSLSFSLEGYRYKRAVVSQNGKRLLFAVFSSLFTCELPATLSGNVTCQSVTLPVTRKSADFIRGVALSPSGTHGAFVYQSGTSETAFVFRWP